MSVHKDLHAFIQLPLVADQDNGPEHPHVDHASTVRQAYDHRPYDQQTLPIHQPMVIQHVQPVPQLAQEPEPAADGPLETLALVLPPIDRRQDPDVVGPDPNRWGDLLAGPSVLLKLHEPGYILVDHWIAEHLLPADVQYQVHVLYIGQVDESVCESRVGGKGGGAAVCEEVAEVL